MAGEIEFWFDFISPYAYLAWCRAHAIAEAHERELVPRPVLFAALLDHWGQLGPAEIPPKRIHTFKQITRRAHARGLAIAAPPGHPFNPLLGLRIASLPHDDPAERRRLIDTLYRAVWAGGPGIHEAERVHAVLDEAGFDGAALIRRASAADTKQRLIEATSEALAKGVFGVPTMIVDGELFGARTPSTTSSCSCAARIPSTASPSPAGPRSPPRPRGHASREPS